MKRGLVPTLWLCAGMAIAAPPDTEGLDPLAAEILLRRLTLATLAISNCPEIGVTTSEWMFLSDTAAQVAGQLGFDSARYDSEIYGPASTGLEISEFCTIELPKAPILLDEMIAAGGTIEKYKPGALNP